MSKTDCHPEFKVSRLLILSKIPSHPRTRKSRLSTILRLRTSGIAVTTPGLPPYFSTFASISPKVRQTDNRPGNTLGGPTILALALYVGYSLLGEIPTPGILVNLV